MTTDFDPQPAAPAGPNSELIRGDGKICIWPTVSLIVLNWNQRDLTLRCLESLSSLDYPARKLEIILVDNGSTDGSAQAVVHRFPAVTVLRTSRNVGFVEGNNVGLRRALEGDARYVMLLNNDTTVHPRLLVELLAAAEFDAAVGIVGPKMLYSDRPEIIWCAGNRVNWRTGESIRLQAEQVDTKADQAPSEVDFITACGICLRREVIEQIGLLDARYFAYYEEADWCMRAQAAGWRVLYVPRARLWHKVSATLGAASPVTDYYMNRNVLLFLARHRQGLSRLQSLLGAAGRNLLAIAAYTVKPHGGQRLPHRNARLLALRDAALGRWGKMGHQSCKYLSTRTDSMGDSV